MGKVFSYDARLPLRAVPEPLNVYKTDTPLPGTVEDGAGYVFLLVTVLAGSRRATSCTTIHQYVSGIPLG